MLAKQPLVISLLLIMLLSGCAAKMHPVCQELGPSYSIKGKTYRIMKKVAAGFTQQGVASWYGPGFHGKKTASGSVYNMFDMTAAHNVLPLNTMVKVKNLENGREILVRINDRGPFVNDRVIDLSLAAARKLAMVTPGTAPVQLTVVAPDHPMIASALAEKRENSRDAPPRKGGTRGPNPFFSGERWGLLALIR